MSNASMDTVPADAAAHGQIGTTSRAALVGAGIVVAILAIVLLAHVVNGSPKTAASASGAQGTAAGSSSAGTSMEMSTPSAMPTGTTGTQKVMTIRGASLPALSSTSAPMAMAMVPLGQAQWDGMTIAARTSAPATFLLFDGTSQTVVKPTAKDSFHLMVTLADAHTNYAIPYSSVWATIRTGGKIVFDERLWPMISRYMGPHYGNNVDLPAAGLYHLTLLISPPAAARHIEYKGLWLKPHRVNLMFHWIPRT